ncbi:MAG TPA: EscU/YscU/HrcU family type III secretion system export apparatus switch protein [Bryobacteraceae bacterium]|nr:EscU/YscU/HrcU family type III secretion system export apparatus switch protein [Bryobacteraceae bacterium]
MSDNAQRTEKATPQRLKKAREKGDYPAAREFVAAIQFFAFVVIAAAYFPDWVGGVQSTLRMGLKQAFRASLTTGDIANLFQQLARAALLPLAVLGGILMALTLLLQMAATNAGFSLARLSPKFERLSPASRLKDLPANNLVNLAQASIMIPVMLWLTWSLVRDRLPELLRLPMLPVATSAATAGGLLTEALRKSASVLVALGAVMLIRERARYARRLRMSKQEIRDEAKENEGNPQIKARIRRIQRDMRRRNMMREVPGATAVIVNPTHYAVALKYDQAAMTAPQVVAKGKNYIAARIRQRAIENQVPIIENPPLAQALYKSVDVGQEIPPHLYRAVAEILAYIFRLMHNAGGRQP